MRSGSATMSRTVIRGLSEAYGSWKTIWMSRRTARICFRLKPVMSSPSKTIVPDVGSSSFMIVRPSVVLPQPDSPTTPSVSPARMPSVTPSTARTCPMVRRKKPALIGKCLTRLSMCRRSRPFDAAGDGDASTAAASVSVALIVRPRWLQQPASEAQRAPPRSGTPSDGRVRRRPSRGAQGSRSCTPRDLASGCSADGTRSRAAG